jgi:hypothetical protein
LLANIALPLVGVVSALLGTWAGYRLKAGDEKKAKHLRVRATWGAISAEVEACKRIATMYLTPDEQGNRVAAPQWRLPDVMLASSLRALLADGDPTEKEVDALLAFHSEVDTLNRGLDLVQQATQGFSQPKIDERRAINDLKAKRIASDGEYYVALRLLIDKHVPRTNKAP